MRHLRKSSVQSLVAVSVFVCILSSVVVSAFPQWVWSPEADTGPKNSIGSEKEKPKLQLDDTQARLFLPTLVNAISGGTRPGNRPTTTSRPSSSSSGSSSIYPPPNDNNSGGGSTSGGGGSFGQGFFTNFLQGIFGGGASTLPASIGSGSNNGGGSGSAACTCEDRSRGCFLPAREVGSCNSGTGIRCCSNTRNTRTFFPEDGDDVASTNSNSVRTVTRTQIRRGLLKNIVRGSGSVIDDTIDLLLHPFLTKDDQLKVATRILGDS